MHGYYIVSYYSYNYIASYGQSVFLRYSYGIPIHVWYGINGRTVRVWYIPYARTVYTIRVWYKIRMRYRTLL